MLTLADAFIPERHIHSVPVHRAIGPLPRLGRSRHSSGEAVWLPSDCSFDGFLEGELHYRYLKTMNVSASPQRLNFMSMAVAASLVSITKGICRSNI